MRIKRIELIGFKSFYEKTVFNFHPGITAIVGPNGCGKSNIVDAFRWVLGEQSAKSLRGRSMEDVIFSGSTSKKPKGMAEVTLIISGGDSGASSENGEISVTRRLYRSGESDYLINKVPCRLKDIKDLFLDTGLELKTYSILEQGRMDEILNSKPEDRRFLIEEVAGVMKYKVRKAEALQKLEASQINLQRLQDIIAEVKRQLNSIDRYARRAERYKQLFEEAKDLEVRVATRDITLLNNELLELTSLENTLKSKEAQLEAFIHRTEALIEQKRLISLENEKGLQEIQTRLHSLQREIIEGDAKVALLKNDSENLKERLQRLTMTEGELLSQVENLNIQLKEIEDNNVKMNLELSNLNETIRVKGIAFSDLENEIFDLEQALESERGQLFDKAEALSTLKNEISNLTSLIENLEKKEKKNIEDISSLKEGLSLLSISIKEAKDRYSDLESALKEKIEFRERLIDGINKKKEELTKIEGDLYKDREELAAMSSRLESLIELHREKKEGIEKGIKILCQVADIFESPPEYEIAIEAALGEKLAAAVLNDHEEVKKALGFIKEHKIHRSAFIPLRMPHNFQIPLKTQISYSSDRIIGKAIDLVKVREGFENIALSLLGDVVIVDNLNTAFELWYESLNMASAEWLLGFLVTLEGDVIEPSGMVYGGVEKGILRIKREIKGLERDINNKRNNILQGKNTVASLKDDIASTDRDIVSLNDEISRLQKDSHELQLKIVSLEEEDSRQEKRLKYLCFELDEDKKEREMVWQTLKEKNKTYKLQEDERYKIEDEIKNTQNVIAKKKDMLEVLRAQVTETRLSLGTLKEKMDSMTREKVRVNTALLEVERKRSELSEERSEIERQLIQKESEIKEMKEALKSYVAMVERLQVEGSNLKEILEAKKAELSIAEKEYKSYMAEIESVRKELTQVEIKKTEASLKLKHINEDIKKSYGVELSPLEESLTDESLKDDEERLPSLRERLQEIGPVNLGALEEFEELKMRYEFLTKQQDDILQSIKLLQDVISTIDGTTRNRLTEAFEALNERFKEVFTILFGKGRAELILTSDDILTAGIEVVAQPPGKRLQNLMLLSGGEKAMTALSLLFAGFMIRPTPLCILDEVDAPLDESNTDRFTALLKELAKNIQFITITHNRRTMEVVDYIYGITMEEPGISKVVSMQLVEAI